MDLIIELTHRYIAATLTTSVIALLVLAWLSRRERGISGRGGLLRPVVLAAALVVAAALLGAVTVWLELANKAVIVAHLSIAMSLVAVLVVAVVRGGELVFVLGGPPRERKYGEATEPPSSFERQPHPSIAVSTATARASAIAAALGFIAVVLGALTANVTGANSACAGIPLCRGGVLPTEPLQYIQFVHRIIAFALFAFVGILGVVAARRGERRMAVLARLVLTLLFLQLVIAGTMVVLQLPAVWRSLHAVFGTLLWVALFYMAYTAHRLAFGSAQPNTRSPVIPSVAEASA